MTKFKAIRLGVIASCVAAIFATHRADADTLDLADGMGSVADGYGPLNPNFGAGDGRPWEWYYQGITLDYGHDLPDGRENDSFVDDPSGNIPYFIFDGTDRSSAGHCLQVVFTPPNFAQNPVNDLRLSFIDSNGHDSGFDEFDPSDYGVVRLWIQNNGSSLYWHIKIADMDGDGGSWNQGASMNIWRLDYQSMTDQAHCTTGSGVFTFLTIIGHTGSYQVCDQYGTCKAGG
jgi:hypothetical protein